MSKRLLRVSLESSSSCFPLPCFLAFIAYLLHFCLLWFLSFHNSRLHLDPLLQWAWHQGCVGPDWGLWGVVLLL